MGQQQTTTKVITLAYDVTKKDVKQADEVWQSYLEGKIELQEVLKKLERWLVMSKMIP